MKYTFLLDNHEIKNLWSDDYFFNKKGEIIPLKDPVQDKNKKQRSHYQREPPVLYYNGKTLHQIYAEKYLLESSLKGDQSN